MASSSKSLRLVSIAAFSMFSLILLLHGPTSVDGAAPKKKPAHHPSDPTQREFPIRGKESELQLNCPTMPYDFPLGGTIRCRACQAVSHAIATRVVVHRHDLLDVLESVCDTLPSRYSLRQVKNGRRYFAPLKSNHLPSTDPALARELEAAGDGDDSVWDLDHDDMPLSFHTKEERESLPCAPYFLKRYCHQLLGRVDELDLGVEAFESGDERSVFSTCFPMPNSRGKNNKKKKTTSSTESTSGSSEAGAASRSAVASSAEERLKEATECLAARLCERSTKRQSIKDRERQVQALNDCHSGTVAKAWEQERAAFLKYEGAWGNEKVPFVQEDTSRTMFKKNPFSRKGDKAAQNELLVDPDL